MKVKTLAIEAAAKILLDNQLWADVKLFVVDASHNKMLTSEQKRAQVLDDLEIVFGDVATTILNLAIELAVIWTKNNVAVRSSN